MSAPEAPGLDVESVWRDLRGPLLGFIIRRVPDRGSAEDILQEVMLRLHRHAGGLRSAPALGGWIHEIARNAIIDHYRRAVVRRERPAGAGADLDRGTPPIMLEPGPAELRSELTACLRPLLAYLPAIYRDAVTLTVLDGLAQADAAARVGLSTSGMKSRVQRGRAQLKELLLRCCEIKLDRRGGVIDYWPRNSACDCPTSEPAPNQAGSRLTRRCARATDVGDASMSKRAGAAAGAAPMQTVSVDGETGHRLAPAVSGAQFR